MISYGLRKQPPLASLPLKITPLFKILDETRANKMKNYSLLKAISLVVAGLLSTSEVTHAANELPTLKPTGISLDLYRQKLDLKVTDVEANIPGMSSEAIDALIPQLNTTNSIDVYGLRLDYQVNPSFNIFGSLGKVKEETDVSFSKANPILSDMTLDAQGMVYSVGGVYTKRFDPMFAAVTLIHSRIDLDDNPHDIKVTGLIPSVGVKTPIGILTGSLLYQEIDAVFAGEVTAPVLGALPVEVSAVNDNKIQVLAGLRTQLARDFYLNASVGLTDQENYQIQLNKRF